MFFWNEDSKRITDIHNSIISIRNDIHKMKNEKPGIDDMSSIYEKLHHIFERVESCHLYECQRIVDLEKNQEAIIHKLNSIQEDISEISKNKTKLKLPNKRCS